MIEHHNNLEQMTNDVNRMGLLALVVPLALFAGLFYQRSQPVSTEAKVSPQSQRPVRNAGRDDLRGEFRGDRNNLAHLTAASTSAGFTDADFTRHVNELDLQIRKKLAPPSSHGFSIVIQKPFVVIGDEPQKSCTAKGG